MTFKRMTHQGHVRWDAKPNGDDFLRIVQNNCGEYVLLHCHGVADNGITPLSSETITKERTLNACKAKARTIFEPKPVAVPVKAVTPPRDYSHVRLPYRD